MKPFFSVAAALVAFHAHLSGLNGSELRTVGYTGEPAPGTPPNVFFQEFQEGDSSDKPSINAAGNLVFRATLTGSGIASNNNSGLWLDKNGVRSLMYREGSHAPGTPAGVNFGGFGGDAILNNLNRISFHGFLTGTGVVSSNNSGIWAETGAGLSLVARAGDPAPGTPSDVNFRIFDRFLSNSDATAFQAMLSLNTSSSNDRGIWSTSGGGLHLVAREGDPAPGMASGIVFYDLHNSHFVMNASGQLAFFSTLFGPGISLSSDYSVWSNSAGVVTPIAHEGDQAPGMPVGVKFGEPNQVVTPAFNDAGRLAFRTTLTGTGVTSNNNSAIWSDRSGSLQPVIRAGVAAPGTPVGVTFSTVSDPVLNGDSRLAFIGGLTGAGATSSNNSGLWSDASGILNLVVREGDHAPGTPAGVNYSEFLEEGFDLNGAGRLAFAAKVAGPGIAENTDTGIWAQDATGNLALIAREGDVLEVAPGLLKTVHHLAFAGGSGNEDGNRTGFNDDGIIAFFAYFSDDTSAIFLSTAVAVPEAPSIWMAMIGVAFALSNYFICRFSALPARQS
jgi:hypothetical protein